MPRDDDKSLGDDATLQGGKSSPADERSLGDRSTFGGGDGSSLSDLGEFADLPDEQFKIDFYQTLTQLTQSHRLQSSNNASKQLLTMELSFHSKDADDSNS